jgi:hypothetical protein
MPKPPTTRTDLLRGTLDLLILRTLSPRALHGVAIADRIAQVTQGTFDVQPGSAGRVRRSHELKESAHLCLDFHAASRARAGVVRGPLSYLLTGGPSRRSLM